MIIIIISFIKMFSPNITISYDIRNILRRL